MKPQSLHQPSLASRAGAHFHRPNRGLNMSKSCKTQLMAIAAASLMCLPTLASAALVGDAAPGLGVPSSQQSSLAALDFLTQATRSQEAGAAVAGDNMAFAGRGRNPWSDVPAQARSDSDLVLWNLLSIVHAHREGRQFALADRNVAFVLANHGDQPSAVPLPGALWLFVMGLLGLAGTRMTGKRDGAANEGASAPVMPSGGPVPA
jgi:hypothetical protein